MSRVEENLKTDLSVDKAIEDVRRGKQRGSFVVGDTALYKAITVGYLRDIAKSLAVIADAMSKEEDK